MPGSRTTVFAATLAMATLVSALSSARAQDENPTTPGAIANPGSYQGSMALQAQERQQYQQQEQQNHQMQQRLNQNYKGAGSRSGGGAPAVNWWSKPALAPEHNPLLGRWKQIAAPQAGSIAQGRTVDPIAGVAAFVGGAMQGGCKSMFGGGVIAFEPTALQWVAPDGHEEILNHVSYRANGAEVIVLTRDPGAVPALVFGFPSHDHAIVAIFNCSMDRLGARPPAATAASLPRAGSAAGSSGGPPPAGPANSVLKVQAGAMAQGVFSPFVSARIWLTPEDPERAMADAGITRPGGTAAEAFYEDCTNASVCNRDVKVMTAKALGLIRTDAAGHGETPQIPAGRYYIVGFMPYEGQMLFWRRPVDLHPGENTLALNPQNASRH